MVETKPPTVLRVRVTGPEAKLRELLAAYPLEPQSVKFTADGVSLDVFMSGRLVQILDRYGLKIEASLDAAAQGAQRRREIGVGNRFEGGRIPVGLGAKLKKQEAS